MSSPSLLSLQTRKWLHTPERHYQLNHEVLPYEIEFELPINVIQNIYSYVAPKYMQDVKKQKIERMSIELNHKQTTLRELIEVKRRRLVAKKKREQQKQELVANLEAIIAALQKNL